MPEPDDTQRDDDLPEGPPWTRREEFNSEMHQRLPADVDSVEPFALYEAADEEEPLEQSRLGEMGFFEHLEELRWRLVKALIALVACAIVTGVFHEFIIEVVLLEPAYDAGVDDLINTSPMGQVMLIFQVSIYSALILSIPFIIWQIWGFVKPGLYEKERRYAGVIGLGTILCFLAGVSFAYFIIIPLSLGFMYNVQFGNIRNLFSIAEYLSFVLGLIFACGVVFEMPVLSYALARMGVITSKMMRQYWRHAAVIILVLAAIITPTPDPFNQLILAGPLYGLYELSIYVAKLAGRQRAHADDLVDEATP